MGTSESFVIGVFDERADLESAKVTFEKRHRTRRTWFREVDLELNQPASITKIERELGGHGPCEIHREQVIIYGHVFPPRDSCLDCLHDMMETKTP